MKRTLISTLLATVTILHPIPLLSAELSVQECNALSDYFLTNGDLIRTYRETNRVIIASTVILALKVIEDPEAQNIIKENTRQIKRMGTAIENANAALAALGPIIKACQSN